MTPRVIANLALLVTLGAAGWGCSASGTSDGGVSTGVTDSAGSGGGAGGGSGGGAACQTDDDCDTYRICRTAAGGVCSAGDTCTCTLGKDWQTAGGTDCVWKSPFQRHCEGAACSPACLDAILADVREDKAPGVALGSDCASTISDGPISASRRRSPEAATRWSPGPPRGST